MLDGFTDYPFPELGDVEGKVAPNRFCVLLTWDRDKYCDVLVLTSDFRGRIFQIKSGYLYCCYHSPDVKIPFSDEELYSLPKMMK